MSKLTISACRTVAKKLRNIPFRVFFVATSLLIIPLAGHAQAPIPQPVIDQCNSTASGISLPHCLKNGAIGFEMMELARTEEFYGDAATPVIDACATQNDTFAQIWSCFQSATDAAAESAALIGRENIADHCIAGISDPDLNERITETYKQKREERFPNEMFYSGDRYVPFMGCPKSSDEDRAETSDTTPDTPLSPSPSSILDASACGPLSELESLVANSSTDELRALSADIKEMEYPEKEQFAETLGISRVTAEYFLESDGQRSLTIATILATFIDDHHPDLLAELFPAQESSAADIAGQMADDMAEAFIRTIITAARDQYQDICRAK